MSWPESAFHVLRNRSHLDESPLGLRVHLFDGRRKHDIYAAGGAKRLIRFHRARVTGIILALVELGRVHEDAHHDRRRCGTCLFD